MEEGANKASQLTEDVVTLPAILACGLSSSSVDELHDTFQLHVHLITGPRHAQ
jgi:hypothetical protein